MTKDKNRSKDDLLEHLLLEDNYEENLTLVDKDDYFELYKDKLGDLSLRPCDALDNILTKADILIPQKKGIGRLLKSNYKDTFYVDLLTISYYGEFEHLIYRIKNNKLTKTDKKEINSLIFEGYKIGSKPANLRHNSGYEEILLTAPYEQDSLPSLSKQLILGGAAIGFSYLLENYLIYRSYTPYSSFITTGVEASTLFAYSLLASILSRRLMHVKWQDDEKLKEIANSAGVKLKGVAIAPIGTPNAVTFPDKVIVITSSLLKKLNHREALAAFYHELGHIKQHSFLKTAIPILAYISAINYLSSVNSVVNDHLLYDMLTISSVPLLLSYPKLIRRFEYSADKFAAKNGLSRDLALGLVKIDESHIDISSITHPSTYNRISKLGLSPKDIEEEYLKESRR